VCEDGKAPVIPKANLDRMTLVKDMVGEDDEETALLHEMLKNATRCITGFPWCPPIEDVFLGAGIGGVVALFLFHFREKIKGTDDWLWVVVGDLPSAYLVLDNSPDPVCALEGYCELMDDWAKAVLDGQSLDDVYPVKAEPTEEHARMLLSRLEFIRDRIIPHWRRDWPAE